MNAAELKALRELVGDAAVEGFLAEAHRAVEAADATFAKTKPPKGTPSIFMAFHAVLVAERLIDLEAGRLDWSRDEGKQPLETKIVP